MAEDGIAIMNEFKEIWDELGGTDFSCLLRMVTRQNVYDNNPTITDLDISSFCRIDDDSSRKVLAESGYALDSKIVFSIWAGVMDSLGRSSIIEPMLKNALDSRGGIIYNGEQLKIAGIAKGLTVGAVVPVWHIMCEVIRDRQ